MNLNQLLEKFKDIEDFEKAYKCREKEYKCIENIEPALKILLMHLGGIIFECMIKSEVVKRKDIIQSEGNKFWYSQDDKDKITEEFNNNNQQLNKNRWQSLASVNLSRIKNGHDFPMIISECLARFNRSEIQEDLDRIFNPLNKDDGCFIDLRYCSESDITDEDYRKWKISYERCNRWLQNYITLGSEGGNEN